MSQMIGRDEEIDRGPDHWLSSGCRFMLAGGGFCLISCAINSGACAPEPSHALSAGRLCRWGVQSMVYYRFFFAEIEVLREVNTIEIEVAGDFALGVAFAWPIHLQPDLSAVDILGTAFTTHRQLA